jgi:hypothetical protein
MDVRELAPALVAIADMIEGAHDVLNPGGGKINVHVKGTFKLKNTPMTQSRSRSRQVRLKSESQVRGKFSACCEM